MSDKKIENADTRVAEKVKESANQIWLAGLGAYAKAEEEGSKLFDNLVHDGEVIETKTRGYIDKSLNVAKDKVDEVKAKASGSWNKVERAFDLRVSKALGRLNIPTRGDVDGLVAKIAQLNSEIETLTAKVSSKKTPNKKADD
ncbi:poly(hydroxyalkanoate) granule-associated protein [Gammaproteobacteria bacterium 45_16_T64]|nr:poly(hydroxyalkanoate) granule-associated protein [Gammaproteobacteria bacterium 45_16_T64]